MTPIFKRPYVYDIYVPKGCNMGYKPVNPGTYVQVLNWIFLKYSACHQKILMKVVPVGTARLIVIVREHYMFLVNYTSHAQILASTAQISKDVPKLLNCK